MAIQVDLPGLDRVIPEIPDSQLVALEGDIDRAKNFFVHYLARSACAQDRGVTFVTSRDGGYVRAGLSLWGDQPENLYIEEASTWSDVYKSSLEGAVLIVDSFSYLVFDLEAGALRSVLRDFRRACRERGLIVVLVLDRGMLSEAFTAVVGHSADAVIEFHTREGPDGVLRFLRIQKAFAGATLERNIHYAFDGRRISVDLRNRVL